MTADLSSLVGVSLSGRYRLERLIGQGGMGAVFEATQLSLGRRVAVKVMRSLRESDPEAVRRFERETEAIARLNHPNIVQVIDGGRAEDGTLFLAMELLDGESLAAAVRREGALALPHALTVLEDVLSALVAAHEAGIIHRDLKGENVMLVRVPGTRELAKVLDFGVAKMKTTHEGPATGTNFIAGTPGFIAPEQMLGTTDDPRSDLYSLGAVMFEMLTGAPPFRGATAMELMMQHLSTPAPRLQDALQAHGRPMVPPAVDAFVGSCLAKELSLRPSSSARALEDIRGLRASFFSGDLSRLTPSIGHGATATTDIAGPHLPNPTPRRDVSPRPSSDSGTVTPLSNSDATEAAVAFTPPPPPPRSTPTVERARAPSVPQQRGRPWAAAAVAGGTALAALLVFALAVLWRIENASAPDGATAHALDDALAAVLALDLPGAERLLDETPGTRGTAAALLLTAEMELLREGSIARADASLAEARARAPGLRGLLGASDVSLLLDAMVAPGHAAQLERLARHDTLARPCPHGKNAHALLFATRWAAEHPDPNAVTKQLERMDPERIHPLTALLLARAALDAGDVDRARQEVATHLVARGLGTRPPVERLIWDIELAHGSKAAVLARMAQLERSTSDPHLAVRLATLEPGKDRWALDDVLTDVDKTYPDKDASSRVDLVALVGDAFAIEGRAGAATSRWQEAARAGAAQGGGRRGEIAGRSQVLRALLGIAEDDATLYAASGRALAEQQIDATTRARVTQMVAAARVLRALGKGTVSADDLQGAESAFASAGDADPSMAALMRWHMAVARAQWDLALEATRGLPPCWRRPLEGDAWRRRGIAQQAAGRLADATTALEKARAVLDEATSDDARALCASRIAWPGPIQHALFIQALVARAELASEDGRADTVGVMRGRFEQAWPWADTGLRDVRRMNALAEKHGFASVERAP